MGIVLYILLYGVVSALVSATVTRYMVQKHHEAAILADEKKYKDRWKEAVILLMDEGKISPEDAKLLMLERPNKRRAVSEHSKVHSGFSDDRRDVEIARAEKGLPPADDLEGMFSDDIKKVEKARIEHGTAT